ncbi:MAG: hypothetical protein ACI9VR_000161 [Cognaticolwellia sp.]
MTPDTGFRCIFAPHQGPLIILLTLALGLACEGDSAQACNANADQDQDGLNDCDEADLGTDPTAADSDEDGYTDAEEIDCLSDPLNADEACYACGWQRSDPNTLVSDGAEIGDVVANAQMIDVCEDMVDLWDFHGEYHILYRTAAW